MQLQLLQIVTEQFGLQVIEQQTPVVVAQPVEFPRLHERLRDSPNFIHDHTNERTRAGTIVAPLLLHLAFSYGLSLYSGNSFNADIEGGLSGTVDHLFSRVQPQAAAIEPLITAVVETKTERSLSVSHCLVQMMAAQRVNGDGDVVYRVVTTGMMWRFLKLQGETVTIDLNAYPLFPLELLLSLLVPMIQ